MSHPTVIVGMSGGVDSSVSAYLLKKQGYHVIGLFMKNWDEVDADGQCPSAKEYADVISVCEKLEIPYYSVNFVQEYQDHVFSEFLEELKKGHTPNPDILCNREIKFKAFLNKAMALGADYLATGHYCQKSADDDLLRGDDPGKDQSYFLYTLNRDILKRVLFPIGHLQKSEVRRLAKEAELPTFAKKDSTGICFIGKRNFKNFTGDYLGYSPGPFLTTQGERIGTHDGIAFYTIGQRKGLKIGGAGDAWFVVGKDIQRNAVILAQGEDHPALYRTHLTADNLSWVAGTAPLPLPYACTAKIRYRAQDVPCLIESIDQGVAHVRFVDPQRAITPRQSIVFYQGPLCLGGGMIQP